MNELAKERKEGLLRSDHDVMRKLCRRGEFLRMRKTTKVICTKQDSTSCRCGDREK